MAAQEAENSGPPQNMDPEQEAADPNQNSHQIGNSYGLGAHLVNGYTEPPPDEPQEDMGVQDGGEPSNQDEVMPWPNDLPHAAPGAPVAHAESEEEPHQGCTFRSMVYYHRFM